MRLFFGGEKYIKIFHFVSQGSDFSLPDVWDENTVYSTKLDVDLETEVGEGLGRWAHHVLGLDTLCGHT